MLDGPFDVHGSPAWARGAFIAQSRAAMLVARVLAPPPGERVLDLCAAPGGKTTHLAALMDGAGEVLAVERDQRRAGALARPRSGCARATCASRSPTPSAGEPPGAARGFDRVLVDPPCSGLGTLQARADLRWRVTPAAIAKMAARSGARYSPPAPRPSVRAACLSTLLARSLRLRMSA